jgi:hypothetical protein
MDHPQQQKGRLTGRSPWKSFGASNQKDAALARALRPCQSRARLTAQPRLGSWEGQGQFLFPV